MRSQALTPITKKEKQKYIAHQFLWKDDIRGIIDEKKYFNKRAYFQTKIRKEWKIKHLSRA
jgi:hypothetical protein